MTAFHGKRAVVVGGSSGIGAAVAEAKARFARADRPIEAVALDVSRPEAVQALFAGLDRLDLLVNCAGIIRRQEEYDLAVFERVLAVNLTGTMAACTAAPRPPGRRHRQHRLHVHVLRRAARPRVHGQQGGRRPAHEGAGGRVGPGGHPGERRGARLDRDAAHRAGPRRPGAERRHREPHPDEAMGEARGGGGRRPLPLSSSSRTSPR